MNKSIKTEKKFEFFLGLFFLIPPILGVFLFIFDLFDWSNKPIVKMRYLDGQWTWHDGGTGASMSPAPLYLGLMAIAGVLLVKDSLRYLVCKNKGVPASNEKNKVETAEPKHSYKNYDKTDDNNINEALGL